jgi:hypothetical protein
MPSIIQYALGFESLANIFGATLFTFFPAYCLSRATAKTDLAFISPHAHFSFASPSSITLLQAFGTIIFALTVPLVMCIKDRPGVEDTRRVVYWTLGVGEALLIPLLLIKAMEGDKSGFKSDILVGGAANLVPILLWRVWVLGVKPGWLIGAGKGKEKV